MRCGPPPAGSATSSKSRGKDPAPRGIRRYASNRPTRSGGIPVIRELTDARWHEVIGRHVRSQRHRRRQTTAGIDERRGVRTHPGACLRLLIRRSDSMAGPRTTGSADPGRRRPMRNRRARPPSVCPDPKVSTAAKYSNDRTIYHVRLHPDASGPASIALQAVTARSSGRRGGACRCDAGRGASVQLSRHHSRIQRWR